MQVYMSSSHIKIIGCLDQSMFAGDLRSIKKQLCSAYLAFLPIAYLSSFK